MALLKFLEAESDMGFRGTGSTEGVSSEKGVSPGWGMGSSYRKVLQPNLLGALEQTCVIELVPP